MLDPRLLRGDPEACAARLATRGFRLDVERFRALEERRKALQVRTQDLQSARNRGARAIGQAKAQGLDIAPLLAEAEGLGGRLKTAQAELQAVLAQLEDFQLAVPNLPHESVPEGSDERANRELRRWGEVPRMANFLRAHEAAFAESNLGNDHNSLIFNGSAQLLRVRSRNRQTTLTPIC